MDPNGGAIVDRTVAPSCVEALLSVQKPIFTFPDHALNKPEVGVGAHHPGADGFEMAGRVGGVKRAGKQFVAMTSLSSTTLSPLGHTSAASKR